MGSTRNREDECTTGPPKPELFRDEEEETAEYTGLEAAKSSDLKICKKNQFLEFLTNFTSKKFLTLKRTKTGQDEGGGADFGGATGRGWSRGLAGTNWHCFLQELM